MQEDNKYKSKRKCRGKKNTWHGGDDAAGRTSGLVVLQRRLVAQSDGSQRFGDPAVLLGFVFSKLFLGFCPLPPSLSFVSLNFMCLLL